MKGISLNHHTEIKKGVDILADLVSSTLGPSGTPVIVEREDGRNKILTKDGVTVAKEVFLEEPIGNIGVQIVKEVASNVAKEVGDGTTTSIVLARAIFNAGLKNVAAGANPMDLKRGMDKAVTKIVENLKNQSRPISSSAEIAQVGSISANNDQEIGNMIADVMLAVGKNGVITVEKGKTTKDSYRIIEGLEFNTGYLSTSRYFVNTKEGKISYEDCYVVCVDKTIKNVEDLIPLLESMIETKSPLLIVANDIEGEALNLLVLNKVRGNYPIIAVKSPHFGDRRSDFLQDLALVTNSVYINEDNGDRLSNITIKDLSKVDKVTVFEEKTIIAGTHGDPTKIQNTVELIEGLIEREQEGHNIRETVELYRKRLASLMGAIGIIDVGGRTEVEVKEKKDRVDDALHATRAAVQEGVVPGGGVALLKISDELKRNYKTYCDNTDEEKGFESILNAVKEPFKAILSNRGVDFDKYEKDLKEVDNFEIGFNAHTLKLENLVDTGVLDPTKVTRLALENAASIASLLVLSKGIIYQDNERNQF